MRVLSATRSDADAGGDRASELWSDYGKAYNLSYTFNSVNALTAISDGDDGNYGCTVTCDANGNITQVDESQAGTGGSPQTNYLYSYFTYDALNRLAEHKTKAYVAGGTNAWVLTRRTHAYDALGRLTQSGYRSYNDGDPDPGATNHVHAYSGSRLVQNVSSDGQSFGARWHWAGAQQDHGAPLKSPNPDTASQSAYNYSVGGSDVAGGGGAGGMSPQRRTFVSPTTEGDQRHLFGQGRPMAKDAGGSGASWYQGTLSAAQNANQNIVESRLFFTGTTGMSGGLDLSRATDVREKGRVGLFGTAESYAGAYGRVTSESIGRDLNPLGRGDGQAYVAGALALGSVAPLLSQAGAAGGTGNSVNNPCGGSGGDSASLPWWPRWGDPGLPIPHDTGPWPWWPWRPRPPKLPRPEPPPRPNPPPHPTPPGAPPSPGLPPGWWFPWPILPPPFNNPSLWIPQGPGHTGSARPHCAELVYHFKKVIKKIINDPKNECNKAFPLPTEMADAINLALNPSKTDLRYHFIYFDTPRGDDPWGKCPDRNTCAYTPQPEGVPGRRQVDTYFCCENCLFWPLITTEDCMLFDTVVHELVHAGDVHGLYHDPMQDLDKEKLWATCACGISTRKEYRDL